jgi:hypothetical protein
MCVCVCVFVCVCVCVCVCVYTLVFTARSLLTMLVGSCNEDVTVRACVRVRSAQLWHIKPAHDDTR